MRNLFLPLALVAAGASPALAQRVHVGLKAGTSYTKLRGNDPEQLSSASNAYYLGFHGGALVNFAVTQAVSIQPELLYSQKGARNKINHDYHTRLHYLDLPIAVKVALGQTGFFVDAGPQFGYLLRGKSGVGKYTYKVHDQYERIDIGFVAGLGYQLPIGLQAGFRYNGGFTRLNKPIIINNSRILATDDIRNGAFQFYLGYQLASR
ncbi:porin family protein [Hymenobacter sp. B81]|uniref:porin family protein n=1 Tax=Hymenobacter sp. B81 TaxID=3344878 RepID=UPI0037DDC164